MQAPARRWSSILALLLLAAGCGSSSPATPSTPPVTDTLTGTLDPTNLNAHTFTASAGGTATITLVSLDPPVQAVGIGLGAVTNGNCSLQVTNSPFTAGAIWETTLAGAGQYCVAIYDIGFLTQSETYSIKVVHP